MTSPYTDRSERSSLLPWSTFCSHARRERAIRLRMAGVQLEGAGYASGTKLFLLPRAADGHDKGDEGKRSRRAVGAAIPWPPPGPGARGRVPRESSGPATTRRAFERPPARRLPPTVPGRRGRRIPQRYRSGSSALTGASVPVSRGRGFGRGPRQRRSIVAMVDHGGKGGATVENISKKPIRQSR